MDDAFLTNQASTPLSLGAATPATGTIARPEHRYGRGQLQPAEYQPRVSGLLQLQLPRARGQPAALHAGLPTWAPSGCSASARAFCTTRTPCTRGRPAARAARRAACTGQTRFGTMCHDQARHRVLLGFDAFYDAPIDTASRTALTLYGVYYNFDLGPNYARFVGA
ncbi:MAG: hypothetical protein WKG07_16960 [Hymenobacter sp.]